MTRKDIFIQLIITLLHKVKNTRGRLNKIPIVLELFDTIEEYSDIIFDKSFVKFAKVIKQKLLTFEEEEPEIKVRCRELLNKYYNDDNEEGELDDNEEEEKIVEDKQTVLFNKDNKTYVFELIDENNIGKGAYGTVYADNDNKFVFKNLDNHKLDDNGIHPSFIRETSAIQYLSQCNQIINIEDIIHIKDKNIIGFMMKKYEQDLKSYINKPIPEIKMKKIVYQILQGLYRAEIASILHRDLKPGNILLDEDLNVSICDWGLARFANGMTEGAFSTCVQTLWYRCPELLLGCDKYGFNVDIWSVGVIICVMLNGEALFSGDSDIDQLYQIFRVCGTPTEGYLTTLPEYRVNFPTWERKLIHDIVKISKTGGDLLSEMLCLDPTDRISVLDALNHSYFDDIRNTKYVYAEPLSNHIHKPMNGNIDNQKNINDRMRSVIIDWLLSVTRKFRLQLATYFLAIKYIDLYMMDKQIDRKNLKLLGITCFMIASKINEVHCPSIRDFIYITDDRYTSDEVKEMEIEILYTFKFNMFIPTEYVYLKMYCNKLKIEKCDMINAIQYLLYALHYNTTRLYNPKDLAYCTLYKTLHDKSKLEDPVNNELLRLVTDSYLTLEENWLTKGYIKNIKRVLKIKE